MRGTKTTEGDRFGTLTDREWEVLFLICTNCQDTLRISEALDMSIRTVESHVRNILMKTGTGSKTALVVLAINEETARRRCFPHLRKMSEMSTRVVVACINPSDESELVPVLVRCTNKQFRSLKHLDAARLVAVDEGYGEPMVVFDHAFSGVAMIDLFDWEGKDVIHVDIGGEA
jgi:DNA-binding CsgD family transcriptional regulator